MFSAAGAIIYEINIGAGKRFATYTQADGKRLPLKAIPGDIELNTCAERTVCGYLQAKRFQLCVF